MKANWILLKAAAGLIPSLVLFICLFADRPSSLLFHSTSAAKTGAAKAGVAKAGARQILKAPRDEGFVISDEQGLIACHDATPEEAQAMTHRDPAQRLHVITPLSLDLQQQQTGLKIILRGTSQLDGFPAARDAFIRAAAKWEAIIQNPITVIIDVDFGPMRFGQPFGANTIGSTRSQLLGDDELYPALRSRLISRSSGAQETTLYNSLPGGMVPTDIGSTANIVAPSAIFRALNFINPTANPETENFGPAPSIGFNSAFSFDFDPSDGVGSNQIDFDSTAVHEIGHLLGFVSFVGSKELDSMTELSVSLWDLFRFRPGANLSNFSTAQRILSSGGDQVFFDSGAETPLSTGRPNGEGGDGNQASHWKADELTGRYIGIMDPSTGRGARELLTENDLRVIDAVGYQLRTVASQPGSAPAIIAPATIDFGVVAPNTAINRLLTLRNTGTAILSIASVSSLSSSFSVLAITNSFAIAPGGQETIVVRLPPMSAGSPTGTISIASNDPARGMVSIPVRATVSAATPPVFSTVSAASFVGTRLASEAIAAGFGLNLATSTQAATTIPLPLSLAGTTVSVTDITGTQRDAPLFFASAGQVNYQIPSGTMNGPATVSLISGAGAISKGTINIASVAPGLFAANPTGQGVAAAVVLRVRPDNSQSFEPIARFEGGRFVSVPISLANGDQVFLLLFGTGIRSRTALSAVSAAIGGVAGAVIYAGPQGFIGLDQANVLIPQTLAGRGEVDLVLTVDGVNSNVVRVNFR
ncbi:MAG TPA: NF038122 family metalloprotease [Blastocatellia bacterium]|nr:NF038122 family metalloprotease [Blastocatellia bacterium]